jgi:NitT/TauT family transport system substrate-binding protein
MVMDTFGCTPKFLADNPKAAKALAESLLRRARHDRRTGKELRHHGRRRQADGRAVREAQPEVPALAGPRRQPEVLRRRACQFSKEAADLLLEIGIIKQIPDLSKLADTRFIK